MHDAGFQYLVFPGGGEMARGMRDYPWDGSALGHPGPAERRAASGLAPLELAFPAEAGQLDLLRRLAA